MTSDDSVNLPSFPDQVKTKIQDILERRIKGSAPHTVVVNDDSRNETLEVSIKPARGTSLLQLRELFTRNGFEAKITDDGEVKIDGSDDTFASNLVNFHRVVMHASPDQPPRP